MRLDAALRGAGRTRGVDAGGRIARGHGRPRSLQQRRLPGELLAPALRDGVEGLLVAGGVLDRDQEAKLRELELRDLVELRPVLADAGDRAGVGQDVGAVLARAGLVDRNDDGAEREQGVVAERPLDARVAEDADEVAAADAERVEPGGELLDPRRGLSPRQLAPACAAAAVDEERRPLRCACGGVPPQLDDRLGPIEVECPRRGRRFDSHARKRTSFAQPRPARGLMRICGHTRLVRQTRRGSATSGLPVATATGCAAPSAPLGLAHPRAHPNAHQASRSWLLRR